MIHVLTSRFTARDPKRMSGIRLGCQPRAQGRRLTVGRLHGEALSPSENAFAAALFAEIE